MRRAWPAILLVGVLVAACGPGRPTISPTISPSIPASPASGDALLLTCDGRVVFPATALDAPPGAEAWSGQEFDALRDALRRYGPEMGSYLPATGWRLVGRDGPTVVFLAEGADGDAPTWRRVTIELRDGRWQAGGAGGCDLRSILGAGVGAASWSLDPAYAVPGPGATEIHVQVWERACASGTTATGRVVGPAIVYDADAVTVTYGVREKPGAQDCQGNPPTPVLLELAEPLGDRALLDGGSFPAAPPSPPF